MNSDRKKTPRQGPAAAHRPAGRTPLARPNSPRVVQPKTPAAPPSAGQTRRTPTAPPVYRPQPTPKVLQTKSASAARPAGDTTRRPAAPPAYRPEAKKIVQPKPNVSAPPRKTPVEKPSPSRQMATIQRRISGLRHMSEVARNDAAWQFYSGLANPARERFRYFLGRAENLSVDEVEARLAVDFNDHNITWIPVGDRIEAHCPWQVTLAVLRERADDITRYQYDEGRQQWVYRLTWPKAILEEFSGKDKDWSWKDGHILFSYNPNTQTARVFHSGPGG